MPMSMSRPMPMPGGLRGLYANANGMQVVEDILPHQWKTVLTLI